MLYYIVNNILAISCCSRKMANEISFMDMEEWACYSPAESGEPLLARLCVQMSAEAMIDGQFKFTFNGDTDLDAEVLASNMALFGGSLNYKLAFSFPARDVWTSPNMISGAWSDLEER